MEGNNDTAMILIVDDDEMVRMTLSILVENLGYNCLVAGDSTEAIATLKSTRVDLVLTDIVMPGMDGLELLANIKEKYRDTDVIVSTGYSEKANYAEVIKAGAIDFIKKPIEQAELEAKLARAMRERKMLRELQELSRQDPLTRLNNRRSFDERFSYEFERALRQKYPLMLAIIDIDNFKDYNDNFGHQKGDKVLISLAEIMRDCTRASVDMCFRLGGDEFAVLLPQATSDQGTEILQRILSSFVERNFATTTLSIGLVSCTRDVQIPRHEDEERIKELADRAMYKAKANGKNRVVTRA